ncbi:hypothetical protein JCM18750_01920 [Halostagnicola bangensis]
MSRGSGFDVVGKFIEECLDRLSELLLGNRKERIRAGEVVLIHCDFCGFPPANSEDTKLLEKIDR